MPAPTLILCGLILLSYGKQLCVWDLIDMFIYFYLLDSPRKTPRHLAQIITFIG